MESHVLQHSSHVASCFVFSVVRVLFCFVLFSSWIWREGGTGEDAREELLQLLRVIKAIKSFLILIGFKDRTKAYHLEDIALLSRNLLQKRKMLEMRVGGVMCSLESGDLNINSLFSLRTHQS